jgi:ribose transport system substrate-binding protein
MKAEREADLVCKASDNPEEGDMNATTRRRNQMLGRAYMAAVIAITLIVVGSGCGEGSEPNSVGGSAGGDAEAAKELVAKHSGEVSFISPGKPIDVGSLRGRELWIISADLSIPFHQNIVGGAEDAARAAGLVPVRFDGKGQAKEWSRGIDQAVAAGAGAIALVSIDPEFVSGSVQRANAADVPVIGVLDTDANSTPLSGTSGEATNDYVLSGRLLAAYATTHTDGPVHALHSDTSEFRLLGYLKDGLYDGMKEYCGSECSLSTFDTQIANFKTQLPTLTQSQLKTHPDTNFMFPAFDAQAVFVMPAIKQAGFAETVKVGSINAVKANLDLIVDEDVQLVDVGVPNAWLGWAAVDRMMRAMLGEQPATSEVPIRLFDQENLQGVDTDNESELYPGVDFQAEYQQLWR